MFGINPYAIAGALLLLVVSNLGTYFYGHNEGYNAALAEQAASIQKTLDDFGKRVGDTAKEATRQALAEFKEKTDLLAGISDRLQTAQGVINAASTRLQNSLRGGACVLSAEQRRLLECVRRPESAGCAASPAPLRPAISR